MVRNPTSAHGPTCSTIHCSKTRHVDWVDANVALGERVVADGGTFLSPRSFANRCGRRRSAGIRKFSQSRTICRDVRLQPLLVGGTSQHAGDRDCCDGRRYRLRREATARIRVGAGGVMLPNHSPLVIAEQFGTLAALYPGRIDLGLGRAPGSDHATARALRRGA